MSTPFKWSYMEHWRVPSARGPVSQYVSMGEMDRFVRQLAAVGITGLDVFFFSLFKLQAMFGSLKAYESFLRDRGLEKLVGVFFGRPWAAPDYAPHVRATHDAIVHAVEMILRQCEGLAVENLIVMPTTACWNLEPVTDDKLHAVADLWNRVGRLTEPHGVKTGVHHEFWAAVRTPEQIDKFYAWTDPDCVHFFCDAAQHVIAGVDPVELYRKYHDRCSGFHFKDTRNVDLHDEYRSRPDAELLAPSVERWFYEMGAPGGRVDFPGLMRAMRECGYQGWIGVEHDKADIGGSSYPETTACALWYAKSVLDPAPAATGSVAAARPPWRWSYAMNQWKSGHDLFVRRAEHERAFKTLAASGFHAIELYSGSGRWEPMGRKDCVEMHYGSVRGLLDVLRSCGIERVSSYFYDCEQFMEEDATYGLSPAEPRDHAAILAAALPYIDFLREAGGSCLVVKAAPSWWKLPDIGADAIRAIADCWSAVGQAARAQDITLALHIDCLSALRNDAATAQLLACSDRRFVALAVDTAELTIAGHDPVGYIERFHDWIAHVHLKDARHVDELDEYRLPVAEHTLLEAGGARQVERWFYEMGTPGGRVDFPRVLGVLEARRYTGWLVVESDQSPLPASSVMLNAWYARNVLRAL
jgi:inosose dehydratase